MCLNLDRTRAMKILFCTNAFETVTNGPAKFANLVLDINTLFPEHQIQILTEDVTFVRPFVHKMEVRVPHFMRFFGQVFRSFQYHRRAMEIRRDFAFDVIVYNNALVGWWSAARFENSVGMINDYSNASRRLRDFKPEYRFIQELIFKQIEHISTFLFKKIITNSDYLTTLLKSEYPNIKHKVHRLYKGVETPESVQEFRPILGVVKILFVKRDYTLGGFFTLTAALKQLKYPTELTVVGPWEYEQQKIEQQAGGRLKIKFLPFQQQAQVFELYKNTDIFCVPSHKEAFGVANVEALARGVSVVSSDAGGIPEVLDYGRCGWLAPIGNALALAEALTECIENETLRQQKIQNGLQFSQQFFKEKLLRNFVDILAHPNS